MTVGAREGRGAFWWSGGIGSERAGSEADVAVAVVGAVGDGGGELGFVLEEVGPGSKKERKVNRGLALG